MKFFEMEKQQIFVLFDHEKLVQILELGENFLLNALSVSVEPFHIK